MNKSSARLIHMNRMAHATVIRVTERIILQANVSRWCAGITLMSPMAVACVTLVIR